MVRRNESFVSKFYLFRVSEWSSSLFFKKKHRSIFRYLCKEAPYGGELSYSEDNVRDMHNADLCDTVGNLVHRATNLCQKYCGGLVPDVPPPSNPPINLGEVVDAYVQKMDQFELEGGANVAIQAFRNVNKYMQDEAPWLKKGDEHAEFRQIVVRATLEAIYALSHLLLPFMPVGPSKIFHKLNMAPTSLKDLGLDCRNLEVGTKVQVGEVLYAKVSILVHNGCESTPD